MKTHYEQFISKVLLLVWAIFCTLLFINLSGKMSYVQWSNLGEWYLLGGKLERLDPIHDMLNLFQALTGIIVFSIACTSLGAFVVRKVRIYSPSSDPSTLNSCAVVATDFLIGQTLFSLIFLTLGGLYRLTSTYVLIILSIGFLLGLGYIKDDLVKFFLDIRFYWKANLGGKKYGAIAWLSISILAASLFYSTARISYDSTAVYFSDAKLTAMARQIQFFAEDNFVASSFQSGIQFTVLIQVFGDQSARLFSWICGIILIILSLAVAERLDVSRQARLALVALLLTSTAFLDLMGDGKVDIISSALALAAVYWMITESQNVTPTKPQLMLIGFFISTAIVARPFNAFLMGIFVIQFYGQRIYLKLGFQPLSYKLFITSIFWIGVGSLGMGAYHLFTNWMILGDPLGFLSVIPKINPSGGPWNYNPDTILAIRLLYPFVATFYNSPQTLGNISPMVIAFLPTLLVPGLRRNVRLSKELYVLFFISLTTLVLWIFLFFTVYEIRYVLFLWIILFMPLAELIAEVLENKDLVFRNILSMVVIGLLLFIFIRAIYIPVDTYSPVDEDGNPQCFCQFLGPINQTATPGDRILTFTAFRYYLRSDLFACSTKHDEYRQLRNAAQKDAESFWIMVYEQGYKYIIYQYDYTTEHLQMPFIPGPDNAPEWLELEAIYGAPGDVHIIYLINIKDPPSDVKTSCRQNTTGIWEVKTTK